MIIKELESKINKLDQATFQTLCDSVFTKKGFNITPYGTVEGTNKTRKGAPDSYSIKDEGIIFFQYTTQKTNLLKKLLNDVNDCFNKSKDFKNLSLKKIIYVLNNNCIDSKIIDEALSLCKSRNVEFQLYCLNELCDMLQDTRFATIAKDILNINVLNPNTTTLEDFINNSNNFYGINHKNVLCGRNDEKNSLKNLLITKDVVLVSGEPGVGKSMLVVKTLSEINKQTICIKSNALNFIEDLLSHINNFSENIIFFDDVNEVPKFKNFIKEIPESFFENNKIICTIRNYALKEIEDWLSNLKNIKTITFNISRLTDDLIQEILTTNLNIRNKIWLERISDLSKGNPRMAIMAGEISKNEGIEMLIDSRTTLKRYFNIANSSEISKMIKKYHKILGIISFLKRIDVKNLASIKNILKMFNVNEECFRESIQVLLNYEIVDLLENRIVKIQDQNLSDYVIYYSFYENSICELSDLIANFIGTHKSNIIELVHILLNIYSSEETKNYIKSQINDCWDTLEKNQSQYLNQFILAFFMLNKERSVLYFSKKLKSDFKLYTCDPEYFFANKKENECIYALSKINNKCSKLALFYFLDYEIIRNDCLDELKKNITKNFIFNNNYLEDDWIIELSNRKEKKWFNFVTYALILESLKFNYEYSSFKSDKKLIHYGIEINDNFNGAIKYRTKIWELSVLLNDTYKYSLLFKYAETCRYDEKTKNIFNNDIKNINTLLNSINRRNHEKEKILKTILKPSLLNSKIDLKIISTKNMNIYEAILWRKNRKISYEEDKKMLSQNIKKIASTINNVSAIKIINICELCLKEKIWTWSVNEFVTEFFSNLDKDTLEYLFYNEPLFTSMALSIQLNIIKILCHKSNYLKVINYLLNLKNKIKSELLICFFENLSENEINTNIKKLFKKVIEIDIKSDKDIYLYNKTLLIKKIIGFNRHFISCVKCIFNKKDEKTREWLNDLFNERIFQPNKLLNLFLKNNQLSLFEDIFIFMLNYKEAYYLRDYFYLICDVDFSFFTKISDMLIEPSSKILYELFDNLWQQKKCYKYANYLFKIISSDNNKLGFYSFSVKEILAPESGNKFEKTEFIKWATKRIGEIKKTNEILILSNYMSNYPVNDCLNFYELLINKRLDLEIFKEILSYPTTYSWSGSQTKIIKEKIEKLNKIKLMIPENLEFLKYNKCVTDYIFNLEKYVKNVKIREILNEED